MRRNVFLLWLLMMAIFCDAQKMISSFPVTLKKGGSGFYGTVEVSSCFLKDPVTEDFMILAMDNSTMEYLLYDNKGKLKSDFSEDNDALKRTYRSQRDNEYMGGTAGNGRYYFMFKTKTAKFSGHKTTNYTMFVVDPVAKNAESKELFDIPKDEKQLVSFGDFGHFFSLFTDDDASTLKIYGTDAAGENFSKTIPLSIPETSKSKKLSDYLDNLRVITQGQEAGIESATAKVKIFHSPDKILMLINDKEKFTRVISINTQSFEKTEFNIDHSSLADDEKDKPYINSYILNNNLYTLVINKKNIKLGVYDLTSKQLIQQQEINEETNMASFAEMPLTESRRGKKEESKEIDNIKKLFKALDTGTEGILVNTDKKGKIAITIGTYAPIIQSGGGSSLPTTSYIGGSGGSWSSGHMSYSNGYLTVQSYAPGSYYLGGEGNYYKTTHFKLLIDSSTFKPAKGQLMPSVAEQIKDYLSSLDEKTHSAMNQFSIANKQYIAYYNKKEKTYIIEEINIHK